MEQKEVKKIAYLLPNMFTALNLGCGFFSIITVQQGLFFEACVLLIIGSLFDSVDGRVARLTGTNSSFGEQFDSISDVVSFGMAPAFLIYHRFLFDHGRLGIITCFIFCLCGSLRLARFNANINEVSSDYFQGLPIPMGALALIGYTLISLVFPLPFPNHYLTIPYVLFYSFLMISNIPFNSFKNSSFVKEHTKFLLLVIIALICLIIIYDKVAIFTLVQVYTLGSITYYLFNRGRFGNEKK